ncbi:MAG TPA: ATP-dependent zinc metalloprotease FtsH [Actinomycetota bacterium]|nr:ATP-dependent zinc metalloprotease FtsH [Actinomycetota bacterium]
MSDEQRERKNRLPFNRGGPGKEAGPAGPAGQGTPSQPPWWNNVGFALAVLVVFLLFQGIFLGSDRQTVEFSRFLTLLDEGRITEASVGSGAVTGEYEREDGGESEAFTTTLPPNYETNDLIATLREQDVKFTGEQPNPWVGVLISFLPFLLIVGIYLFIMRRMRRQLGGGPLSFGRNKAKLYDRTDMKTTFRDVAGVDEVETELVELVEYLKRPEKFKKIGARIPKGVLLVGPPGTGKTLLARAIAGEADVPFFYISASEFIEMFVGLGAARVRDLFKQARERAPAIVFIDEIDSIGQSRAGAAGNQLGSHQEQEQTLQQLLTEMDGFEPNSGVIIVAASNRPEVLDQALLRPGRFDRQIVVNLPDIRGRAEILAIHARSVQLEPGVDLKLLARRTPGFSGAQLANVINEAALLAARRGKESVGLHDLEEAIDRVVAGLERRSQVLSEPERRLVAYHELGHALVALFVDNSDPVHRVSIIPRGIGALGYTQQLPDEERYLMSEPELRDRMAVLLGGRAAEELIFGYATTGAQDDLRKATEIARRMVMEFGMSKNVGPINIADQGGRFLGPAFRRSEEVSDETEMAIDREVKALLLEARDKAGRILSEHKEDLDNLAAVLLEKESLGRQDLEDYFGKGGETQELEPEALPGA